MCLLRDLPLMCKACGDLAGSTGDVFGKMRKLIQEVFRLSLFLLETAE